MVVDNEKLICIVLRGLPRDFAHFCSAIRTRSDPITYEQLAIMLQSEEQAIMEHLDSIPHSLPMFSSNSKPNGNSQNPSQNHGSGKGRGKNSFNRGRGGGRFNSNGGQQFKSQAPQGFSPHNNQSHTPAHAPKANRPTCQICWKSGHSALDCYHRMNFSCQGKNPPAKLTAMASATNATITNNQDPWLVDSGTSDHLTANLNNLAT